jgi:hypothetical protein
MLLSSTKPTAHKTHYKTIAADRMCSLAFGDFIITLVGDAN